MHKSNFHYVAMPTMTSQILKYLHLTRTQESIYLENETLFFLQIKKKLSHTQNWVQKQYLSTHVKIYVSFIDYQHLKKYF